MRSDPLALGTQPLKQDFAPANPSIAIPNAIRLYSEGVPLDFTGDSAEFLPALGLQLVNPQANYVHAARFGIAPNERPTNDGLFTANWSVDVLVGPNGLQADMEGAASEFRTAFPSGVLVKHGTATVIVADGVIQESSSSVDGISVQLQYEVTACGKRYASPPRRSTMRSMRAPPSPAMAP